MKKIFVVLAVAMTIMIGSVKPAYGNVYSDEYLTECSVRTEQYLNEYLSECVNNNEYEFIIENFSYYETVEKVILAKFTMLNLGTNDSSTHMAVLSSRIFDYYIRQIFFLT